MASGDTKDGVTAGGEIAIRDLHEETSLPPPLPHSTAPRSGGGAQPLPPRRRRSPPAFWLVLLGLVIVGGAIGLLLRSWTSEPEVAPDEAASAPSAPAPTASAPVVEVPAAVATADDPTGCIESHLAPSTFGQDPKLGFVCTQTDLWKIADGLYEKASGSSEGAVFWRSLGRYEAAVIASVRSDCCSKPPALVASLPDSACTSMQASLSKLGAEPEPATLADFAALVACLEQHEVSARPRYGAVPSDQAKAAFNSYFALGQR